MRSLAEIIQHPLGSFGGAQLCEVARAKKHSENNKLKNTLNLP